MRILKRCSQFLAVAMLAAAFWGCAPVQYRDELVILVPVSDHEPYPSHARAYPAPPITVSSQPTPRYTAIDRQPDGEGTATKTREVQSAVVPETPRTMPVNNERSPVRITTPERDDGRVGAVARPRVR